MSPPRSPLVSEAWESTPAVERRLTRRDCRLAFSFYESRGWQDGTTSKIGCVPNRNSCGTMRHCEVPTNTRGALNRVTPTRG
jgi:hypothetical protein